MRDAFPAAVAVVVLFLVLLVAGLTLPDWKAYVVGEEPPVHVFVIGSVEAVQSVREVIAPERVLASTPEAIVLREGRIIASSAEAVGDPLTAVGWVDRELDIVSVGPAEPAPHPRSAARAAVAAPLSPAAAGPPLEEVEAERFEQLARQPTLTWMETHELLRYMDRTGQF